MNAQTRSDSICIACPACFDLAQTLDCGQGFRWREVESDGDGALWEGIALGRFLQIRQQGDRLLFFCSQEDFETIWRLYFDLETDYQTIRGALSERSDALQSAAEFASGIRILRQDAWEALASFLISQNNNIPRIKGIIERFAALCGEEIEGGHAFPTAEAVARMSVEELAPIRAGFRAKYILAAAKAVADGSVDLEAIRKNDLAYGREALQTIYGVGPKVAECVLLYGFYKTDAFPLDVWMKRAMRTLFPGQTPEIFGKHAGIAQQYIFHYSRMNPHLFSEDDSAGQV